MIRNIHTEINKEMEHEHHTHQLKFKNLFINTNQELVVFMPRSCHVCRSEGFQALTRLTVSLNDKSIIATLDITDNGLLQEGQVSLSSSAQKKLSCKEGDTLVI